MHRRHSIYTFEMRLRFRFVLAWLVLLALPMQGFAAATMLNCGPNHHRMMAAAMAGATEADEHVAGEQHHHEMGVMADHLHEAAADDGDTALVHHLDKLMKFKCSACAACCMGAAMPTAAVCFDPLPLAVSPAAYVPTLHLGFVADGPDKPPRLFLV